MFFLMGLCMAMIQGGYVRRIPHGKEIIAAMSVSLTVANSNWNSFRLTFFEKKTNHNERKS